MGRQNKRRSGNRRIKQGLWFRLYGTSAAAPCHWCGKELTFNQSVLDHEPPLSWGGERTKAVISCRPCDEKRGVENSWRIRKYRENIKDDVPISEEERARLMKNRKGSWA